MAKRKHPLPGEVRQGQTIYILSDFIGGSLYVFPKFITNDDSDIPKSLPKKYLKKDSDLSNWFYSKKDAIRAGMKQIYRRRVSGVLE